LRGTIHHLKDFEIKMLKKQMKYKKVYGEFLPQTPHIPPNIVEAKETNIKHP